MLTAKPASGLGYGCVFMAAHDDVIKWKHFPRYWHFVRGIHRSPVISPQRPVTRSFDGFFDLPLNKGLCKQWRRWWFETPSRPLWRHCNENKLALGIACTVITLFVFSQHALKIVKAEQVSIIQFWLQVTINLASGQNHGADISITCCLCTFKIKWKRCYHSMSLVSCSSRIGFGWQIIPGILHTSHALFFMVQKRLILPKSPGASIH